MFIWPEGAGGASFRASGAVIRTDTFSLYFWSWDETVVKSTSVQEGV
jgi:hypothetical protein